MDFNFFDTPNDSDYSPEWEAILRFETEFGPSEVMELGEWMMRDEKLIQLTKRQFRYIRPHKAWFIYVDLPSSRAKQIATKAFRGLVGRRNLHSSIPALHKVPLWVGTNDGQIIQFDP